MALTVYQQPQAYTPAYNDQFILALSNQIAQPDFKYVVTVQVNLGTEYTLDVLQRPDGYVVVNPIEIVKNYINREWFNPTLNTMQCPGYTCDVLVKVKEFYSNAIQSTTNISYMAFDACFTNKDFETYDYTDYITVGATFKFLNFGTFPTDLITKDTNYWLLFNNTIATQLDYAIYDNSNVLLFNNTITLQTGFVCIDIAKTLLTAYPTAHTIEFDVSDGTTSYYNFSYAVGNICSKFRTYPLYYINRLGVIDYMWFNQLTKQTIDAKRSYVRLGANSRTGNTYGTSSYIRERHSVNIETTKSIALTSGWLSELQSLQLVELFDSPIVWFVKNGEYEPCSIKDSSYTINEHEYEPLFNYVVNLEMDKTETRQRGL